jgi:hypothetical protein
MTGMGADGGAEDHEPGLSVLAALLKAADLQVPASRLPGLAWEYEQIRLMAARIRAEARRPWPRMP